MLAYIHDYEVRSIILLGSAAHRVFKAINIAAFVIASLVVFAAGYVGAAFLWDLTHHRYDTPDTGAYYGHVTATFDSVADPFYQLRFRGETPARWRWSYPTNFAYDRLQIEWYGESRDGTATVSVPSLVYESSGATGHLSQATLNEWLLGSASGSTHTAELQRVRAIFDYIQAAGHGSLPAPRHHTYYFKQPVRAQIQHFVLGLGVPGLVYIWFVVWLFLVVFFGRRFWRRHGGG